MHLKKQARQITTSEYCRCYNIQIEKKKLIENHVYNYPIIRKNAANLYLILYKTKSYLIQKKKKNQLNAIEKTFEVKPLHGMKTMKIYKPFELVKSM